MTTTKRLLLGAALGAGGLLLGACVTGSSSEKNAEGASPSSRRAAFDEESYDKTNALPANGSDATSSSAAPSKATGTTPAGMGAGGSGTTSTTPTRTDRSTRSTETTTTTPPAGQQ